MQLLILRPVSALLCISCPCGAVVTEISCIARKSASDLGETHVDLLCDMPLFLERPPNKRLHEICAAGSHDVDAAKVKGISFDDLPKPFVAKRRTKK